MMSCGRLTLLAVVTLVLGGGCTWWGPEPGQVQVQSDPPGADVYVMGEKVGVTPISVPQELIFPVTYPAAKQDLYGTVTLRKAGCADSVRRVSTGAVSRGIHARLDCEQERGTARGQETKPAPRPSLEQRLRHLKDLQDKGLITDEDAAEARRRMLGEL